MIVLMTFQQEQEEPNTEHPEQSESRLVGGLLIAAGVPECTARGPDLI